MADGTSCKHCGNTSRPDTECSRCGGYGLVTGMDGSPDDCPDCGCSGAQWPPICPGCGKYRSMKGWVREIEAEDASA